MKTKAIFLVITLLTISLFSVSAFRLSPMVQEFTPSGAGARQSYTVSNTGSNPIAVRIEFAHREIDKHGNETLKDAANMFVAFPQQMVVQPNSQQIVRVQYRGPAAVSQEQSYRIIARQLPVAFEQQQRDVNINIMFVYQGSLYITPPQTRVGLTVESVGRTYDDEGNPLLTFEVKNTGNVHVIVGSPSVTVRSRSGGRTLSQITLQGEQLPGINGVNILAGGSRIASIPWPENLSEGDLDATSFTFNRM